MKTIAVSIDESTLRAIDHIAEGGLDRSDIVRLALDEFILRRQQAEREARERQAIADNGGLLARQAREIVAEQANGQPSIREQLSSLVEEGRVDEARLLVQIETEKGDKGEDLGNWPELLAPPTAAPRPRTGRGDFDQNAAWLRQHQDAYRGCWVALRDGMLVDSDTRFRALRDRLRARGMEREVLCLKVSYGDDNPDAPSA